MDKLFKVIHIDDQVTYVQAETADEATNIGELWRGEVDSVQELGFIMDYMVVENCVWLDEAYDLIDESMV